MFGALVAAGGLLHAYAALGETRWAACSDCHREQAAQFRESVHHRAVRCQECHGGKGVYELTDDEWRVYSLDAPQDGSGATPRPAFDHGNIFRGVSPRANIPALCGSCHADVAEMNPYGLRTDQLAAYWTSGHGKTLAQNGDDRVAVCIDCHGTHDVLRSDNPRSRTHFRNIPETCGRCHSDRELMAGFELSADVVDQYKASIHGHYVLELGDPGAPHCASCHGSHAATPPGFASVGHVCGQCHQQIEEYFLEGTHGRLPGMPRCVGCHGDGGDITNHQIREASPPPDVLLELWESLVGEGGRPEELRHRFESAVQDLHGSLRLDRTCLYCHAEGREDAHAQFFTDTDRMARGRGVELAAKLRQAQFEYVRTAERVDRIARGVLLVQDEALQAAEVKTELQALYAYIHTLDQDGIGERADKLQGLTQEISQSLDKKEMGLAWRRGALVLVWGWAIVGAACMFRKYVLLKRAYVTKPGGPAGSLPDEAGSRLPTRRRVLDVALSLFGAASGAALLWPAVAYCLPVRKRGGGRQRVSVGSEDGWVQWEARKVAVAGKPVVVLRTQDDFRAYSAVCTHLACLVHWSQARREFECPCHAARFDAEGQVLAGPPPAPLPAYNVAVVQGEVIVTGAASG